MYERSKRFIPCNNGYNSLCSKKLTEVIKLYVREITSGKSF
jgi:hypothetical protein